MNLFIIPSWYPSKTTPVLGSFTQEQALATAELNSDIRVIVSTWGHEDGFINHRNPKRALNALRWRLKAKPQVINSSGNYVEVFSPCLTWSDRLFSTGLPSLTTTNRQNLQTAIAHFGPVDLIHAHVSYPAGHIAQQLSQEFGIPYVITEHMSPFPFTQYLVAGQPRQEIVNAISKANMTIAVSDSLADKVASYGLPRPIVIPNLVDERNFSIGNPVGSRFVFFTLCLITAQKGIDHLLQSIAAWDPPADKFEFRIGGDGYLLNQYKSLAHKLGISDRIKWLGSLSRKQAADQFKKCHAYVMPSRHETFGVVYAEAIACGKPVIATKCGGPESIVNEGNGILVDIGDIQQLSNAMQTVSATWAKYEPSSIRADFMRRFSRKAVTEMLTTLYSEIVRSKSR